MGGVCWFVGQGLCEDAVNMVVAVCKLEDGHYLGDHDELLVVLC